MKLNIINNVLLEINFNVTARGDQKLTSLKKDDEEQEEIKQFIKIDRITYKEPDEEEMNKLWVDFIKGLVKDDKNESIANYDLGKAIGKEIARWRKEFLTGYTGILGKIFLDKLDSKDLKDNISSINMDNDELQDFMRSIILRLQNIEDIENKMDFTSKANRSLRDMKVQLIIINDELSSRTKCFINNLDKSKEKEEEQYDISQNMSDIRLSNKDVDRFNKVFEKNVKIKKETNINKKLKYMQIALDKIIGKKVNPYMLNINHELQKADVDVYFLLDVNASSQRKKPVFVPLYIIEVKYNSEDKLVAGDVNMKGVKAEDFEFIVNKFVQNNPEWRPKSDEPKKESKNLKDKLYKKLLKEFLDK